jgi:hypothetical protein
VNQPLGAPAGCGIAGTPIGRAAIEMRQGPFKFPANAIENDVTAFLENEAAEGYCDENGDDDRFDPILRVFKLADTGTTPTEVTASFAPPHVMDAAPLVNERQLVVSNGIVFGRRNEKGHVSYQTIEMDAGGDDDSEFTTLSADGRFPVFRSRATNLTVPAPSGGATDAFLYDSCLSSRARCRAARPARACEHHNVAVARRGRLRARRPSHDGRYVVFESGATTSTRAEPVGQPEVYLRDRVLTTEV